MNIVSDIWKSLKVLGFLGDVNTMQELASWLRRVRLTYTPPTLKKSGKNYVYSLITFLEPVLDIQGKFGKVFHTFRETASNAHLTECYLKVSPNHPGSLLLEGILQTIACSVLARRGFAHAVPRVLDIVNHPEYGITLSLERVQGSVLFAKYLEKKLKWGYQSYTNDCLILEVFAQVATYTAILEHDIGINHRDLKSDNVLMVTPDTLVHQTVSINGSTWTVKGRQQVILIDFGFSCIGRDAGQTIVSAGDYLPQTDFCPKQGRDLFLFFASLWNIPLFRLSVSVGVRDLFVKWLRDASDVGWADWLIRAAPADLNHIYLLCSAGHFKSDPCEPVSVLRDIAGLYPEIVSMG
jgi:serine/threonine protein kinase